MEKIKINYFAVIAIGFLFLSLAIFLGWSNIQPVLGSTIQGNDYQATSTAPSTVYGATITTSRSLFQNVSPRQGALSSVVITGANTGIVNFYNATTSDVNLRTGQKATSTILIASLPASLAAGDYTFDVAFTDGLYIDVTGTIPTTTITYR